MTVVTAPGGSWVAPFVNCYSYNSSPDVSISVRADPAANVASVIFKLDGVHLQTENVLPYAVVGDKGGQFNPWRPTPGGHLLTATPYSHYNGTGTAGPAINVSFTAY